MYFVGIHSGEGVNPGAAVFLELSMKSVKKQYHVREVRHWNDTDDSEIEKEIAAIHADSRYTVLRRVFSQDRRPPRNVPTPPTLVMHFSGNDTAQIDRLRERNIPVEGVAIRDGGKWEKEEYKTICLGNNYRVAGADVRASIAKTVGENRLRIDGNVCRAAELEGMISRIDDPSLFGDPSDSSDGSALNPDQRNTLIALSLPIWFRETIRRIRRY